MKVTLYEALGVHPTASADEVRAALRGLIRQYYQNTRAEQVETEEALRFINHASCILNDTEKRRQYDQELVSGAHIGAMPLRKIAGGPMTLLDEERTPFRNSQSLDRVPDIGDKGPAHHFGLTASISRITNSLFWQAIVGMILVMIMFFLLNWAFPDDSWVEQTKRTMIWATLVLLIAAGIYGLVHWLVPRRPPSPPTELPAAVAQLAILKWRREKTIFMGAEEPFEDQTWLFRLRMTELERAKNHRISASRPALRLMARLFDYGLWGVVLAGITQSLIAGGILGAELAGILTHPLVAPILITATWVPVETVLLVYLFTTPGKWLFGVYLQFGVSNPYVQQDTSARWGTCWRRAFLVWWRGMGSGVPIISLILMSLATETLMNNQETAWDAAEDCLVTHGSVGPINAATGTLSLIAFMWFFGNAWAEPLKGSLATTREAMTAVGGWYDSAVTTVGSWIVHANAPTQPEQIAAVEPDKPSPLEVKRRRWAEYQKQAEKSQAANDHRGAIKICTVWAEEDYKNPAPWRCLGLAQQALGQHKLAVEALQKAAKLDPGDSKVQEALVRSFRAQYQR